MKTRRPLLTALLLLANAVGLMSCGSGPGQTVCDGSHLSPPDSSPQAGDSPGKNGAKIPFQFQAGGVVRGATAGKRLALVFTGHEFAEGGEVVLEALAKHKSKASFFFTGDFLRRTEFAELIQRIVREGHYLGPHSDKHLIYCPWEGQERTLITHEEFRSDLENNLAALGRAGVKRSEVRYFLPPYEHYNEEIVRWAKGLGLILINFTPGTRSTADYTGEANRNFVSSKVIFESIVARERLDPHGLNGFILLLHIGSGPGRTDKFHDRFGELLDCLTQKGYAFVRVDELLERSN